MAKLKPKKRNSVASSSYRKGATRKVPNRVKEKSGVIRQFLKWSIGVGVFAAIFWMGMTIDFSEMYNNFGEKIRKPISNVQVMGEFHYVTREKIQTMVLDNLKEGFLSQKLSMLQSEINNEAWVESVSVKRRWPDTLEVNVVEQKPIARWGDNGVINIYGELIDVGDTRVLLHLPLLKGPRENSREITQTYVDLSQVLAVDKMRVSEISVNSTMGWMVTLDNLFSVELGKENVVEKMKNFLLVYNAGLNKKQQQIEYVDARYEDGVAIKWQVQEHDYLAVNKG